MTIRTVTVLGANGTMGRNISAIFASFGNAKVYMMCRTMEQAEEARISAGKTVRAEAILENLVAASYDQMEDIIPCSDLVFESVAEKFDIKNAINQKISPLLNKEAFLCTGTSGLSIDKLAENLADDVARRYFGIHFYNPPYSMNLCEIIPSEVTNESCVSFIKEYLADTLLRTIVLVKDKAAFLGNRIGFFFINEAFQYAETYSKEGGIDYIDSILGGFTGRNMPPMVTADFVGLDVHKAIVDNVYDEGNDLSLNSFKMPEYLECLVSTGFLGRKCGKGVYRTEQLENGAKKVFVYDLQSGDFRAKVSYRFPFAGKMIDYLKNGAYEDAMQILATDSSQEAKIARDFMIRYVVYALDVSKQIACDQQSADDVMAQGFNWLPPLACIEALGGKGQFIELLNDCDMRNINVEIENIRNMIENAPKSNYDFRKYLKAKR